MTSYKAQNERMIVKILELESEVARLAIALDDANQVNTELRNTLLRTYQLYPGLEGDPDE